MWRHHAGCCVWLKYCRLENRLVGPPVAPYSCGGSETENAIGVKEPEISSSKKEMIGDVPVRTKSAVMKPSSASWPGCARTNEPTVMSDWYAEPRSEKTLRLRFPIVCPPVVAPTSSL